jgi:hypothetical protein
LRIDTLQWTVVLGINIVAEAKTRQRPLSFS